MILQIFLTKDARFEENKEYDVKYETPLIAGYTDVGGDIFGWYTYGLQSGKDYLFVRDEIKALITDFALLSADEKQMAGEFMAPNAPTVKADGILGGDYEFWVQDWMDKSQVARELRWIASKSKMFNIVTQYKNALVEVIDFGLVEKYREGIQSFINDGEPGIVNWIKSTNSYSSGGLINGSFTPISPVANMTDASNLLMDIIKDGNY